MDAIDRARESLTDLCKRLEAFQTPRWAIEGVLDVELTTKFIFDPCSGLGAIGAVFHAKGGYHIAEVDIEDWQQHAVAPMAFRSQNFVCANFLDLGGDLSDSTIIMNPPFSLAEAFVARAQALNARKIICFQRQAWRESSGRRLWWEQNAPARVWVCGARATCWRFDLLDNVKGRPGGMHNSPTSYAWYVWERGHKGAEVTSAIYPRSKS